MGRRAVDGGAVSRSPPEHCRGGRCRWKAAPEPWPGRWKTRCRRHVRTGSSARGPKNPGSFRGHRSARPAPATDVVRAPRRPRRREWQGRWVPQGRAESGESGRRRLCARAPPSSRRPPRSRTTPWPRSRPEEWRVAPRRTARPASPRRWVKVLVRVSAWTRVPARASAPARLPARVSPRPRWAASPPPSPLPRRRVGPGRDRAYRRPAGCSVPVPPPWREAHLPARSGGTPPPEGSAAQSRAGRPPWSAGAERTGAVPVRPACRSAARPTRPSGPGRRPPRRLRPPPAPPPRFPPLPPRPEGSAWVRPAVRGAW